MAAYLRRARKPACSKRRSAVLCVLFSFGSWNQAEYGSTAFHRNVILSAVRHRAETGASEPWQDTPESSAASASSQGAKVVLGG
jgi:hypothetical protein